mmetsp:Transcript_3731/g.4110  ORF Transcript_3731/g.4110 Transcript_3731/m.4110 type:complete len:93 (+) Transcript_3731:399-677(+)
MAKKNRAMEKEKEGKTQSNQPPNKTKQTTKTHSNHTQLILTHSIQEQLIQQDKTPFHTQLGSFVLEGFEIIAYRKKGSSVICKYVETTTQEG